MVARRQTSIKVDAVAWDEAKEIFEEYNLSVTDAINIFLNKVKLTKGLPFDIKLPNDETLKAMQEVEEEDGITINFDEFLEESKEYAKTL
ncbi:MAG: type II toxin-antitoxin system RelB/DinJ family antitoxin [Campylobacterota bacterium]|nr:type II toxin-antitoxin system RelB/DinJ family antitoxin [Campylobacterota bacterium]